MKKTSLWLMVLQVPVDYLMMILAAATAYHLRFMEWAKDLKPILFELPFSKFLSIAAMVAVIWVVVFAFFKLYSPDPNRRFGNEILKIFFGCSIGLSLIALYIVFTQDLFASRFLIAVGWFLAIFYVILGRLVIRGLKGLLHRAEIGLKQAVIIGDDETANNLTNMLNERVDLGYEVVGSFKHFSENIKDQVNEIDEVIFTSPKAHEDEETIEALEWCHENQIVFKYSADLFSAFTSNISVNPLAGIPVVEVEGSNLEGWGVIIKRVFDMVGGFVLMVVTSPLMLLAAVGILIETGRPIIYKNKRIGENGSEFFAYKFRSMYQEDSIGPQFDNNEEAIKKEEELIEKQNSREGPIYKIKDDPRVTPFGGFLRRWSIDELPQFINVLNGTMSLVGPRPHQPREVQEYESYYKRVLSIKPGITGLAQISGRSDLSFEEEMKLDIFYMENWSLYLDLIILVKTPFVLFKNRKAL
ncbi:MAG: sugar transferase [Candidatus Magasanikbacteria bacterium]